MTGAKAFFITWGALMAMVLAGYGLYSLIVNYPNTWDFITGMALICLITLWVAIFAYRVVEDF